MAKQRKDQRGIIALALPPEIDAKVERLADQFGGKGRVVGQLLEFVGHAPQQLRLLMLGVLPADDAEAMLKSAAAFLSRRFAELAEQQKTEAIPPAAPTAFRGHAGGKT